MKKDHRDKLPLIEVKELTWAEALRELSKSPQLLEEPKVEPESFPYGKEALCEKVS